jgi:hypothetical protein
LIGAVPPSRTRARCRRDCPLKSTPSSSINQGQQGGAGKRRELTP